MVQEVAFHSHKNKVNLEIKNLRLKCLDMVALRDRLPNKHNLF